MWTVFLLRATPVISNVIPGGHHSCRRKDERCSDLTQSSAVSVQTVAKTGRSVFARVRNLTERPHAMLQAKKPPVSWTLVSQLKQGGKSKSASSASHTTLISVHLIAPANLILLIYFQYSLKHRRLLVSIGGSNCAATKSNEPTTFASRGATC